MPCESGGGHRVHAWMCGWEVPVCGGQVHGTRVPHPGYVQPLPGGELLPRLIGAGDMPRAHVLPRGLIIAHSLPGGVLQSCEFHGGKRLCGVSRGELLPKSFYRTCVLDRGLVLPSGEYRPRFMPSRLLLLHRDVDWGVLPGQLLPSTVYERGPMRGRVILRNTQDSGRLLDGWRVLPRGQDVAGDVPRWKLL